MLHPIHWYGNKEQLLNSFAIPDLYCWVPCILMYAHKETWKAIAKHLWHHMTLEERQGLPYVNCHMGRNFVPPFCKLKSKQKSMEFPYDVKKRGHYQLEKSRLQSSGMRVVLFLQTSCLGENSKLW
jgi:hypothetical protein